MTSSNWQSTVFAYLPDADVAAPAGQLNMLESGVEVLSSTFGYGSRYLQRGNAIPVDPVSLPLDGAEPGGIRLYAPVNGLALFGAIRDAMPDAWGRRVIENKLSAPPNGLRESVYLQHAGSNRLGALDFRSAPTEHERAGILPGVMELHYLVDAADRIQNHEPVPEALRRIFDAGPSMGGARPKAVVVRDGVEYLAKFPADNDVFDVPLIEFATLQLARRCGLNVPEVEWLPLPDGRSVMLIARFDRVCTPGLRTSRKHVVSGLTMLGLHEGESPDSSYMALADVISRFGAKGHVQSDREELFGRMVFNILVSNNDDHLRNHAFVWNAGAQGWRLSPLYDVVPTPQVAQERYLHLAVGQRGRLATLDNALSAAGRFGLLPDKAAAIIERVAMHVREWRGFFEDELHVPARQCDLVTTAFRRPDGVGLRIVGGGV